MEDHLSPYGKGPSSLVTSWRDCDGLGIHVEPSDWVEVERFLLSGGPSSSFSFLPLNLLKRPFLWCVCPGDAGPSAPPFFIPRLLWPLGVGLCARDREPYIVFAPPFGGMATLACDSSLLIDGRRARGSSLLLLCRCEVPWPWAIE